MLIDDNIDDIQVGGHLTYHINKTSNRKNVEFNCEEITYQLNFSETNLTFTQAIEEIYHVFHDLCDEFVTTLNEKDKIRLAFIHPSLKPAINLPFMNRDVVTPENLLAIFERVAQSKRTNRIIYALM